MEIFAENLNLGKCVLPPIPQVTYPGNIKTGNQGFP